jgi:hypothetical protein
MVRTLILSAALATGALTGTTATASAAPPTGHDHDRDHDRRGRYEVLVRHRGHWDAIGVYRDRDDAMRVARQLERRGQDAKVERVRGGR